MNDYLIGGAVCAVITALAFIGMWYGWRAKQRRAAALRVPSEAPGELLGEYSRVLYVVTHSANNSMERVALKGLTYRGYSTVRVKSGGVEITVAGEEPVALTDIVGVSYARNSLAKAVERDGLTQINWRGAGRELASILRFQTPHTQQEFMQLIEQQLVRKGSPVC